MARKNKTANLQEFLPALAALAGPALASAAGTMVGKKLTSNENEGLEEEELEENNEISEVYLSMLENQLEEEGTLDEFGLGEACDEEIEETYPAQVHYPHAKDPKYPRHKNAIQGEGVKIEDEITANRGAEGLKKEDMFDEETYPHQTEYPGDKPNFPRIVHVRKGGVRESFILTPIIKEQGGAAMAGIAKKLWPQLLQIIASLPPELLAKIPAIVSSTISGKQAAGGAAGANFAMGESYLSEQQPSPEAQKAEQERQKWLQDFLAQKPPSVSDEQAKAIGDQIMQQIGASQAPTAPAPSPAGAPQLTPLSQYGNPELAKVQGQLGSMQRTGLPTNRNESKQFVMTKRQLKEALKESILLHEKKKLIDKLVHKHIHEQVQVKKLCNTLLEAGPLSNLWQKTGGKLFGGDVAQAGGLPTAAHQASARNAVQDQAKQNQRVVAQALKSVERAKGKFNQETLKSANLINQYHDAVLNLVNLMGKVQGSLAPMELQQLQNQVNQSVGQLQYDLESERSGIDTFLDSLSKNVSTSNNTGEFPTAQELGQQAKTKAEKERAAEFPGKGTKTGRLARSPGLRRETKTNKKSKS